MLLAEVTLSSSFGAVPSLSAAGPPSSLATRKNNRLEAPRTSSRRTSWEVRQDGASVLCNRSRRLRSLSPSPTLPLAEQCSEGVRLTGSTGPRRSGEPMSVRGSSAGSQKMLGKPAGVGIYFQESGTNIVVNHLIRGGSAERSGKVQAGDGESAIRTGARRRTVPAVLTVAQRPQ